MNDAVKKRIEQMKELADQIIEKAELLKGDADDVETDEDLYVVELAFDSIIGWAKKATMFAGIPMMSLRRDDYGTAVTDLFQN